MATFTYEQAATLHSLMDDHHATEASVMQFAHNQHIWLYGTDDDLVAVATVNELGDVRMFELMETGR